MLGSTFPILGRLLQAPAPIIPVDDDPVTLARLAAIMSDRVRLCPDCGGDAHVCRVIGCDDRVIGGDDDDAELLLPQAAVDASEDPDEAHLLVDDHVGAQASELVAA